MAVQTECHCGGSFYVNFTELRDVQIILLSVFVVGGGIPEGHSQGNQQSYQRSGYHSIYWRLIQQKCI